MFGTLNTLDSGFHRNDERFMQAFCATAHQGVSTTVVVIPVTNGMKRSPLTPRELIYIKRIRCKKF
jgi:hypothetical protein